MRYIYFGYEYALVNMQQCITTPLWRLYYILQMCHKYFVLYDSEFYF